MSRMSVRQGPVSRVVARRIGCGSAGRQVGLSDEVVRLRGLTASLLMEQEAEHRRISREIHDDLGQKLALLEIQVERMKRTPDREERLVLELESLRGTVAELAEDLHRICHCLHPVILDTLGLTAGIEYLCEEYTRMTGIEVKFLREKIPPASSGLSLCLYRVVQEALHNVAKHARSKRVTVMLCGSGEGIQVMIRDAGCGFDPSVPRTDRARKNQGLGLVSLAERVRLLAGRFEVRSKPGRGTRIVAFVPFASSALPSAMGSDF
jgi:signal transduction histidine kinase